MPLLWVNAKSSNINKGTRKFILAPELQFLNCLQEIVFSLDSISIDNNRDDDVEDWKHLSFFPLRHLPILLLIAVAVVVVVAHSFFSSFDTKQ